MKTAKRPAVKDVRANLSRNPNDPPISPCVDVMTVAGVPISAETIAHRYVPRGQPPCRPHVHVCDNNGTGECAESCCCVCDCSLLAWHPMQGVRAVRLGAVLCPDQACFPQARAGVR